MVVGVEVRGAGCHGLVMAGRKRHRLRALGRAALSEVGASEVGPHSAGIGEGSLSVLEPSVAVFRSRHPEPLAPNLHPWSRTRLGPPMLLREGAVTIVEALYLSLLGLLLGSAISGAQDSVLPGHQGGQLWTEGIAGE